MAVLHGKDAFSIIGFQNGFRFAENEIVSLIKYPFYSDVKE